MIFILLVKPCSTHYHHMHKHSNTINARICLWVGDVCMTVCIMTVYMRVFASLSPVWNSDVEHKANLFSSLSPFFLFFILFFMNMD